MKIDKEAVVTYTIKVGELFKELHINDRDLIHPGMDAEVEIFFQTAEYIANDIDELPVDREELRQLVQLVLVIGQNIGFGFVAADDPNHRMKVRD